ncbi:ribose-phosphate diphosphokinase [Cereibacter sphaeroides]|uniref:ribose-phosphate diphosphokinase n=1 Tax=Cereibacter sphaeroides TaxID=1063 RepID=UPI001F1D8EFC|nr:ribose-phosphate diphosphokinase [Cereibacter sphaeroides]MCE6950267.1 ribose-phosphate diphosphokinase [Cereibacter sphaeroides]
MRWFDLTPSHPLGHEAAHHAGVVPSPLEMRAFAGGEHKMRPLVSVRGQDVFVFSALHAGPDGSVNDALMRLLLFLACCRRNGAARVVAICPWLPYMRKDRQTKARDPVNAAEVARLLEAAGADCVVTAEVHNLAAFQNGFRCTTVHLDGCRLFAGEILRRAGEAPLAVISPDGGGVKRAELLREAVEQMGNREVGFGFLEKRRSSGVVSGELFAGDVAGKSVWIVDDMIDSGGTLLRAAQACRARGAAEVHLLATHLLDPAAVDRLADPAVDTLTVTDSARLPEAGPRVRLLSLAPLVGRAMARIHAGGAVGPLLDPTAPPDDGPEAP